jgi:Na+-transporting NADH:ubiquinone oxidoreductase subunit F
MEIWLGVIVFTAIIGALLGVILAARSWLVPVGEVEIAVNEARRIHAPVGVRLLRALVDADIHVPSACGGIGTCGQCRVVVRRGGGAILPTETSLLTRREVRGGVRLACQVAVREDLAVEVPDEILGVRRWVCRVRSSRCLGTLIKEIVLELPEGESVDFRAGSFVQVESPPFEVSFADFEIDAEYRAEWDRLDLWRYRVAAAAPTTRAYSMANYADEKGIVMLNVRVAIPPPGAADDVPPGVVSSYLFSLKPGDPVRVSGPFGHFFASETEREMVFVGGGVGMAPMRAHILDQLKRLGSQRTISFWYGARNLSELFYREEFDRLELENPNFRWVVALSDPRPEDGWGGEVGFIHKVLYERYLESHPAPEECEYYVCGPPMMMKAVLRMLDNLGVDPENIRFDDFGA